MKRMRAAVMVAVVLAAGIALAAEVTENMNYKGEVNYDKGAIWKINGTKVTATAANLNQLAGDNVAVSGTAYLHDVSVTGSVNVATNLTVAKKISATANSLSLADGSVITNVGAVMLCMTAGSTNLLGAASAAGQIMYVLNHATSSTGVIAIATAGNYVGPAMSISAGEMGVFVSGGTNWHGTKQ